MGVDLTLLPFDCDCEHLSFSHNVLQVPRSYELLGKVEKTVKKEVPEGFTSFVSHDDAYEDPHYGITTKTPYGEKVEYTTAYELKRCGIPGATGAYINELPDDNKVALFWS